MRMNVNEREREGGREDALFLQKMNIAGVSA